VCYRRGEFVKYSQAMKSSQMRENVLGALKCGEIVKGCRVFEGAGQEAIPPPVYIYSCSNIFRRFWSVYQIGGQIFQDLGLSPRSSKSRGGYIHVPLRGTIVLYTCILVLSRLKNLKKDLTSLKYRYIL